MNDFLLLTSNVITTYYSGVGRHVGVKCAGVVGYALTTNVFGPALTMQMYAGVDKHVRAAGFVENVLPKLIVMANSQLALLIMNVKQAGAYNHVEAQVHKGHVIGMKVKTRLHARVVKYA